MTFIDAKRRKMCDILWVYLAVRGSYSTFVA